MELVIDRSKWLRGSGNSLLFRPTDGKMCCLGFYGLSCGLTQEDMNGLGAPFEIHGQKWQENSSANWLFDHHWGCSSYCYNLMAINDRLDFSEEVREREIAKIFAQHGITVKFIG